MKEAMLYTKQADRQVACHLCAHRCVIAEGKFGICGVRQNRNGVLYTQVYDKIISAHIDPIEKKPFYHVLPGSASFSIATVGCNFHCFHCQNHDIAQFPKEHPGATLPGSSMAPEEIVNAAVRHGCQSIAYTYTEPTIFFELAYHTAKTAHERGLKNLFVTNGYMTREALEMISPYLDGANVDLKGFDDLRYRKVCGGKLEPVKESIQHMRELDIWVEVTTLIIPTHNDSETELRQIAAFLVQVDPSMPWHVSAFYPQYKMRHLPPTSPAIIHRAVKIGKEEGIRYVYSGNIQSDDTADTWCYACGKQLIQRAGFDVRENHLDSGKCPACRTPIDGIFERRSE
ncbi:pyruvate-formate lyase-activating enzyme [Candidatus Vecturithrix granuli]|uniref:Pyruvate-formate lyase-activating enzyme n=1 Tax=Vecturithrix granuli TaxID=1499967 RepID=A0A081CAV2_VECG1|nr:pyruvate-formate lyase-activating enzyme [Candidatus Vecturithrix granuli]